MPEYTFRVEKAQPGGARDVVFEATGNQPFQAFPVSEEGSFTIVFGYGEAWQQAFDAFFRGITEADAAAVQEAESEQLPPDALGPPTGGDAGDDGSPD